MTNKHIHRVVEVIRDESDITTSLNITLNLHSATTTKTVKYDFDNGDQRSHTYDGYDDHSIVDSRSIVYNIPEADQTDIIPRHVHPHVQAEELAYQEKYKAWMRLVKLSGEYTTAQAELLRD